MSTRATSPSVLSVQPRPADPEKATTERLIWLVGLSHATNHFRDVDLSCGAVAGPGRVRPRVRRPRDAGERQFPLLRPLGASGGNAGGPPGWRASTGRLAAGWQPGVLRDRLRHRSMDLGCRTRRPRPLRQPTPSGGLRNPRRVATAVGRRRRPGIRPLGDPGQCGLGGVPHPDGCYRGPLGLACCVLRGGASGDFSCSSPCGDSPA